MVTSSSPASLEIVAYQAACTIVAGATAYLSAADAIASSVEDDMGISKSSVAVGDDGSRKGRLVAVWDGASAQNARPADAPSSSPDKSWCCHSAKSAYWSGMSSRGASA